MHHLLWTILIGFVVGLLAKLIMPGKSAPRGFILTTLLGIAGSVLATYLGQYLGIYHAGQNARWIGSIAGSMLLILIYRSIKD